MRILSCLWRDYYGDPVAVNTMYYYFVEVLRGMGHEVGWFHHVEQARLHKDSMNDAFLSLVRGGGYDLVLIETVLDEFYPETLDEARRYAVVVGIDSDDDFRWLEYSSKWCPHFTYMMTTYRHVYEAVREECPNVILGQWACGGRYDGLGRHKDIGMSFVGGIHADRAKRFGEVGARLPIEVFGHGSTSSQASLGRLAGIFGNKLRGGRGGKQALRDWVVARFGAEAGGIDFERVNDLWGRSKISFTPLNLAEGQYARKLEMGRQMGKLPNDTAGFDPWTTAMQVKGRVFEMGLSGTLMLCDRNPMLDEFYDRGVEYEDFESLDECVEKARFYLADESARKRIAEAYHGRTLTEHTWERRFERLFRDVGLGA